MNKTLDTIYLLGMAGLVIIWLFYTKEIFFQLLMVMFIADWIYMRMSKLRKTATKGGKE